jgi:hypothetical protein
MLLVRPWFLDFPNKKRKEDARVLRPGTSGNEDRYSLRSSSASPRTFPCTFCTNIHKWACSTSPLYQFAFKCIPSLSLRRSPKPTQVGLRRLLAAASVSNLNANWYYSSTDVYKISDRRQKRNSLASERVTIGCRSRVRTRNDLR